LREERIEFGNLGLAGDTVSVRIADPAQMDAAYKVISGLSQPLAGTPGGREIAVTRADGQRIVSSYVEAALVAESAKAVDKSIEIIRRRIDQLGTREPNIFRQGSNRIVIQAPGESDPERLKNVIGQTAKLTFQMVDDSVTVAEAMSGRVPPGSELLPAVEGPGEGYELVRKRVLVSGEMLTDAQQAFDGQTGAPAVSFRFNATGAKKFGDATVANVGKRFAIVLDGKVISAPTIINPITGGSGQITGSYTVSSANDLAILLRAGALPTKLNVEQQSTVGAELGADAVKAGQISTVIGFIAIVVFMILAYGFLFGGVSVLGLFLNVLLIIGLMSLFQATLTLPGVAGLILTLAVAVDANVLIYERIRDEERAGHSPGMAIDVGFKRAMVSILDANVTSLISAAIMYSFGSGPVKGFAWTLGLGVFTSLFTALLVSQVLLGWWYAATRPKTLPI
jgi:preprotein translocase subunit SecD